MKEVSLAVEMREVSTRHALIKLREEGKIPGVFYGHNEKTVTVAIDSKQFSELIAKSGMNILIKLKIADATKTAIIKEVQRDVISQEALHIDFQAISLKEKITVHVPFHIEGIAPGVKLSGGIMETLLREISLKCLPTSIPQSITVDVSKLDIGDSIAIKDLPVMEGVEVLSAHDSIIINVVAPRKEEEKPAEEVAAAAAGGAVEPEMITKGKKDEASEDGKPPAGGAAPAKK